MSNNYIGYHFKISPKELGTEILLAELGELPFESFEETDEGLSAYIPKRDWNDSLLNDVYILQNQEFEISHTFE